VLRSIVNESQCVHIGPHPPTPPPPAPAPGPPSSDCDWRVDKALDGGTEIGKPFKTKSKEDCCGYCTRAKSCGGAAYHKNGECTLRMAPLKTKASPGDTVCVPKKEEAGAEGHGGMEWVIDRS
jgi:hypothetical protein